MRSLFVYFRSALAERLLVASVLVLPFASAGCAEKACLRWNEDDRKKEAATGGAGGSAGGGGAGGAGGSMGVGGAGGMAGAGGSGGAGGAGGMAKAGGAAGGGGSGTGGVDAGTAEPPEIECPLPARAMQLLGKPSCTATIESIDSEKGVYDPDTKQCCYEVTTGSQPCGS